MSNWLNFFFLMKEEIWSTQETIKELELELPDAVEAFERAKEHMLYPERELEECKGWIAPIRTIPTEILTEILLFVCDAEHLTPVKLTAVCCLWCQIMLSTPSAWSYIYLYEHMDQEYYNRYLEVFFERSEPVLLHLSIPDQDQEKDGKKVSTIPWIVRRDLGHIQCLTISDWHFSSLLFTGWDTESHFCHFDDEYSLIIFHCSPWSTRITQPLLYFPHLEALNLTGLWLSNFDPRLLTRKWFPVLQSLHCGRLTGNMGPTSLHSLCLFNIFLWDLTMSFGGFIWPRLHQENITGFLEISSLFWTFLAVSRQP